MSSPATSPLKSPPRLTLSRVAGLLSPLFLITLLIGPFGMSCGAQKKSKNMVRECVLPQDQLGTLSGRWRLAPVPVAFHAGDFSNEEMHEIILAADTWNDFYAETLGLSPVDIGTAESPRLSNSPRPNNSYTCAQALIQGNAYTGEVVIYKNGVWPFPSQANAMALTSFCRNPSKPLPEFYMATIDLNYQNFFVNGQRLPDLRTIILHEFGHLLGLNHSCEGTARPGIPACGDRAIAPSYLEALMFPSFSFDSNGYGQIKRQLNENDQGRANCLYMTPSEN